MSRMRTMLSFLLVLSSVACSFVGRSQESICLIPEGYTGAVFIIFDQKDGVEPEVEDGLHVYRILESGVLRTTAKANYRVKENQYYYAGEDGRRTRIEYLYHGGGAWEDKENTFDKVDYAKGEIFCLSDEMVSAERGGKKIYFRQFLVGRARDAERLALDGVNKAAVVIN